MIPFDNKNALKEIMKMSFVGLLLGVLCKASPLKVRGFMLKGLSVTYIIA